MFRPLTRSQIAVDVSIAAFCLLVRLAWGITETWMIAVVVLMAGALAVRRMSPGLALAVLWAGVLLQLGTHQLPDISNVAVFAVLFVTSRYGLPVVRWLGLASALVGAVLAAVYLVLYDSTLLQVGISPELSHAAIVFGFAAGGGGTLFVLSWTLGLLWRTWATARESRRAQATAVVEREVAEREVAVEQERTRIARDMHDVVAHSLAVVIAQADGARYAMKQSPDAADAALTTISTTAREALADVRVLLGQLRHSQEAGPQPALADLDRLLDQMRSSGLRIRSETVGQPSAVPTGQQLAIYRIVQESLTNALRHGAPGEEVLLRFTWTADAVALDVISALPDSATPSHAERPGHGIDGMRERAAVAGGALSAGVETGVEIGVEDAGETGAHRGRFVVRARLPLIATGALAL
jgi:signal transduction histidine kinase